MSKFGPFNFTYHWRSPKTWYWNIRDGFNDIYIGIKNIIRWSPIIWFDKDWDYYFLLKILEYKIKRMEKSANNWWGVNSEKKAKQMRVCIELIKRMNNNDCSDTYENNKQYYSNYFGKLFGKHILTWWD